MHDDLNQHVIDELKENPTSPSMLRTTTSPGSVTLCTTISLGSLPASTSTSPYWTFTVSRFPPDWCSRKPSRFPAWQLPRSLPASSSTLSVLGEGAATPAPPSMDARAPRKRPRDEALPVYTRNGATDQLVCRGLPTNASQHLQDVITDLRSCHRS